MTDKVVSTLHQSSDRFYKRSVLITGACGGLGRQIALDFAAAGAHLTLCDMSLDPLNVFAEELRSQGG